MIRNPYVSHLDGCLELQVLDSTPSFFDDKEEGYSEYFEIEEGSEEHRHHLPMYRCDDTLKCTSVAPIINSLQEKKLKLKQSTTEVGGIYKWYDLRVEMCKEELELFDTLEASGKLKRMIIGSIRGLHPQVVTYSDNVVKYKREMVKYLARWLVQYDISMNIEMLRDLYDDFIKRVKYCKDEIQRHECTSRCDVSQYYIDIYGLDFEEGVEILNEWFDNERVDKIEYISILEEMCREEYVTFIHTCKLLRDEYVNLLMVRDSWLPLSYEGEEFIDSVITFDHFIKMYELLDAYEFQLLENDDVTLLSVSMIEVRVKGMIEEIKKELIRMLRVAGQQYARQYNLLKKVSRECSCWEKHVVCSDAAEDMSLPMGWYGDTYQMDVYAMVRDYYRKRR